MRSFTPFPVSPRALLKSSFLIYGGRFRATLRLPRGVPPRRGPARPVWGASPPTAGCRAAPPGDAPGPGSVQGRENGSAPVLGTPCGSGGGGRFAAPGEPAAAGGMRCRRGGRYWGLLAPREGLTPAKAYRRSRSSARRGPGGAAPGAREAGFGPVPWGGGGSGRKKVVRVPLWLCLDQRGACLLAGAGGISCAEEKHHPSEDKRVNPHLPLERQVFGENSDSGSPRGACPAPPGARGCGVLPPRKAWGSFLREGSGSSWERRPEVGSGAGSAAPWGAAGARRSHVALAWPWGPCLPAAGRSAFSRLGSSE